MNVLWKKKRVSAFIEDGKFHSTSTMVLSYLICDNFVLIFNYRRSQAVFLQRCLTEPHLPH